MMVPFLDLKAQQAAIRDEVDQALRRVLDSCAFAGGPFVEEFEAAFASFCGCRSAVGVGSGTDALWLALLALGVGPGDEVVTVPYTFIATAEAISMCGAKPVFVDIQPDSYNLDPSLLERAITPRTRAVVPVHLFGRMADMDPIMEIARSRGLFVVEDASQAHGAEYKGRRAGSVGDAGCFSFYPTKNLGACGEAGAVVTNDSQLAENIRMLRDHGQESRYRHKLLGWNARMDGFQGAVLAVKLRHLPTWNEARIENARRYDEWLAGTEGVGVPARPDHGSHVFHIYAIRTNRRDALLDHLQRQGVSCGVHYPIPIHLQEAYRSLGYTKGDFPVAEACAGSLLSLPMFPELSREQVAHVAAQIRKFPGLGG